MFRALKQSGEFRGRNPAVIFGVIRCFICLFLGACGLLALIPPASMGPFASLARAKCMKSAPVHGLAFSPERKTQLGFYRDDSCGAAPGCHLRIMADARSQGSAAAYGMAYRNWEACDATIIWLSETRFRVIDDAGGDTIIDLGAQSIVR